MPKGETIDGIKLTNIIRKRNEFAKILIVNKLNKFHDGQLLRERAAANIFLKKVLHENIPILADCLKNI